MHNCKSFGRLLLIELLVLKRILGLFADSRIEDVDFLLRERTYPAHILLLASRPANDASFSNSDVDDLCLYYCRRLHSLAW